MQDLNYQFTCTLFHYNYWRFVYRHSRFLKELIRGNVQNSYVILRTTILGIVIRIVLLRDTKLLKEYELMPFFRHYHLGIEAKSLCNVGFLQKNLDYPINLTFSSCTYKYIKWTSISLYELFIFKHFLVSNFISCWLIIF